MSGTERCLTLERALLLEHGLLEEEQSVRAHVETCTRCQQVQAHVVREFAPPLLVGPPQQVFAAVRRRIEEAQGGQPLTASEIELGRLAIERRLATREQVRECAEQRTAGSPEHLARLLVRRGYLTEAAARGLYEELEASGSAGVQGSAYGSRGRRGAAPPAAAGGGSAPGTWAAPAPNQVITVLCPACGERNTASPEQIGRQIRCRGCAGIVRLHANPPQQAGTGDGFGRHGPGGTQVVAPRYAQTGPGSEFPQGPHGTHLQKAQPRPPEQHLIHDTRGSGELPLAAGVAGVTPEEIDLPNVAMDDPIAHAMSTRQNADGSTETVFGPYDILGEIARGGMGIVYRARQRSLKRIVALKVMKEGENASEKQIRRFKRETEAAAKLQHPNIVAVHEVGCHEAFHYFTMDLIEGDPLDAIVKRKEKMPVKRVLEVVKEVAQAIHYAHGKGIIHRDLKPANVLLDTDGHPKVTDFGLAKQIDHKSMLTRTGAVVGTPFYMPPEQARGDVDIDQRADVYALGVILYELLTLKLPFHGETTMEVYHKILEEEPLPPRKHDSRIDKDLNTIVLKTIDKDVSRRYQNAQELADDVQRYLNGDPIKARPLGPVGRSIKWARKNQPVVMASAATVLALIGSLGLIGYRHHRAVQEERRINKKNEWETFTTEVENQCINARSQVTSGSARLRDQDPQGALADLAEAERILGDLDLLAEDYVKWNTADETTSFLTERQAEIDEIYQEIYLETGRAHALKQTPEGYARALKYLAKGLERSDGEASPAALRIQLEVGRVQTQQGGYDLALATFAGILARDSRHVDARLEMGLVHDRAGQYLEAIECFGDVVEQDPKTVRAYLLRGATRFTLGRYEEALRDFDKVVDLKDDMFEGYVWRGRAHQALGHFGEAQEDLTEAIDITPSLPGGYYYRAELHFAQRKHAQAIKDYEVAISRSAQYYRAYLGLGGALEAVLDYERARQQYDEILRADEREAATVAPAAQAALARLDLVESDPLECRLEVIDRIRQESATPDGALGPPPPLDVLRAESQKLRTDRLKKARSGFERALEGDPDLPGALLGRARLALLVDGDLDLAQTSLERGLALLAASPSVRFHGAGSADSEDGWEEDEWEDGEDWGDDDKGAAEVSAEGRLLARVRTLLGRVALEGDDLAEARARFTEALKADPRHAEAQAGLGRVALQEGKSDEAADAFQTARLFQTTAGDEASYFYGEAQRLAGLAERSKKPEYFKQARQAYARALAINPWHARAWLERARLTAEWRGFDEAIVLSAKAVEADPFLRGGYELRGFLFTRDLPEERDPGTGRPESLRDYVRGEAEFDKAIEVSPDPLESADAYYGRALALLAQAAGDGDPRIVRARDDLQQAISAIPADFRKAEPRRINQSIRYLERYAEVNRLLRDEGEAASALAWVERVREGARTAAQQELAEGHALRDRLNYSEAIKHFDRAIELNETFSDAYYDRGTCYLKVGNFVPGILDFSKALELDPRIADQVYNKVYQISYVVDLNRVITELNKIVSDHPNESHVVFLRGFFYVAKTEFKQVSREDLDLGINDFNRCLQLNPTHVTAFLYRGFLWFKMASKESDIEERERLYDVAMKDYKHALTLDPDSGISHYLQSLSWSVMSSEEGLAPEEVERRKQTALDEMRASFGCAFKGYERIRNEPGFDPIRDLPEFKELMRGK